MTDVTDMREKPCGFLNVLKPPGMSSAQVVGKVRWLLKGEKVGHGGTLDPEAAGVLPLMIGKAARLFDYLQDHEKAYVGEVAFGCATDTQDAQGKALETGENYPSRQAVEAMLPRFMGEIVQRPSMYSAIKQDGKPLYQRARAGEVIEVPTRQVQVHSLQLTQDMPDHGFLFSVHCSKGFYVRSLCHDLGEALGCPAHMRWLLRTQSGVFHLESALTLEEIEKAAEEGTLSHLMLSVDFALEHLPCANVPPPLVGALRNGQKLFWTQFPALHGTAAEAGGPACLKVEGRIVAIARRQEKELKPCTWLGD